MFDIGQFIEEPQLEHNSLRRTEMLLPESMLCTIQKYEASLAAFEAGKPDYKLDCYYDELNSDINVMEVDGDLTSDQAWYLREKYLGRVREGNINV